MRRSSPPVGEAVRLTRIRRQRHSQQVVRPMMPMTPRTPPSQPKSAETSQEEGSREFQSTGAEVPLAVYATIVAAYASILATAWMDFARSMESAWLATVGIIVGVVVLGIHLALRHTNHGPVLPGRHGLDEFLHSEIDTATGRLRGWEAYVQILIIPVCLALAAAGIGAVWVWEG
jgi:hypothetical protein